MICRFVKFDIYFLWLSKEIFFGVITDKLTTSIALEKCKKECDIVEIIPAQGFCPLKIEITQFPDGLRLNFVSRESQCLPRQSRRKEN